MNLETPCPNADGAVLVPVVSMTRVPHTVSSRKDLPHPQGNVHFSAIFKGKMFAPPVSYFDIGNVPMSKQNLRCF